MSNGDSSGTHRNALVKISEPGKAFQTTPNIYPKLENSKELSLVKLGHVLRSLIEVTPLFLPVYLICWLGPYPESPQ